MDGVRLAPCDDVTRLPPEQRRLAEIEAAWRWHEAYHGELKNSRALVIRAHTF